MVHQDDSKCIFGAFGKPFILDTRRVGVVRGKKSDDGVCMAASTEASVVHCVNCANRDESFDEQEREQLASLNI